MKEVTLYSNPLDPSPTTYGNVNVLIEVSKGKCKSMTNSGIYPNISVVLCYPELISCIYNLQAPNLYRLSENLWRKKRKKKKKKGRRGGQQENLKAVELHLSLRQHLQSALPARKTRKEQPDGGGAVVLSSSQRGGGVVGGGELLCHVIEISKS